MFVFLSSVKFTMSSSEQKIVIRASGLNLSVETLLKISSGTSDQHRHIWKRFCPPGLPPTNPTSSSLKRVANNDLAAAASPVRGFAASALAASSSDVS